MTSEEGPVLDLDVRWLSDSNFARHNRRRWVVMLAGVAMAAVVVWLDFILVGFAARNAPSAPTAYFLVVLSLGFIIPPLAAGWYFFRAWSRPPVRVRIYRERIEFGLSSGTVRVLRWGRLAPRLDVLDRTGDSRVPLDSKVVLIATEYRQYFYHFVSPVIPYTFVPAGTTGPILELARSSGLPIREVPYSNSLSGDPSRTWVRYRIGRAG